jgi:hypothetical protein
MICFVLRDFISLFSGQDHDLTDCTLIEGPGSAHLVIVRIIFHTPLQGGFNHKKGDGQ